MLEIVVSVLFAWGIFFAYYVHVFFWKKNVKNEKTPDKESVFYVEMEAKHVIFCVATYTVLAAISYVIWSGPKDISSIISILKLQINSDVILSVIQTVLLNSLLFFGPLVQFYLSDNLQELNQKLFPKSWLIFKRTHATAFLEEMIFRVIIFDILTNSGYTSPEVNFITSAIFSISHGHNLVHVYKSYGLINGIMATAFQMVFTFVFAFYCGKITLKTQSYYCAAILHSYCNALGVPPLGELFPLQLNNTKTQLILGAYVVGVVGFFYFI